MPLLPQVRKEGSSNSAEFQVSSLHQLPDVIPELWNSGGGGGSNAGPAAINIDGSIARAAAARSAAPLDGGDAELVVSAAAACAADEPGIDLTGDSYT